MDDSFSPPRVFVASASEDVQVAFCQASMSLLKTLLPENVMVVIFAALIRLALSCWHINTEKMRVKHTLVL